MESREKKRKEVWEGREDKGKGRGEEEKRKRGVEKEGR